MVTETSLKVPSPTMSLEEVSARCSWLIQLHQAQSGAKTRIRQLLDGGADGIRALLGDSVTEVTDLVPIPPLLHSGLKRLAQKIGGSVPDLKIDAFGNKGSQTAKAGAEKRERVIDSYDGATGCRLELQLPQQGRWIPGYGYGMWVVKDRRRPDGTRYPYAEMRDPYTVYPGVWSVDQQPAEACVLQTYPVSEIKRLYPAAAAAVDAAIDNRRPRTSGGAVLIGGTGSGSWANQSGDGCDVVEYWYNEGTFIFIPEYAVQLAFIPNPLYPQNRFVIPKRFAFNRLNGHYDHVIGLMATMARIQILEYLHLEDNVFTETNIFGESLEGGKYRKGRKAINRLEIGAKVEKPISNLPYQLFQGVDRMENSLRTGVSYPVTDDAQHPGGGWATGQGLSQLRSDVDLEIAEYHKVFRYGIQDIDALRLEWDERRNSGNRRTVRGNRKGAPYSESYDPAEINGQYQTRRVYGVMAGWDEPTKIITGLQLIDGGIIDHQLMQENMDGLEGITEVNERIRGRKAEDTAWGMLQADAGNPDPNDPEKQTKAKLAVVEIMAKPGDFQKILTKYYTPETPEMSPEEEAYLGQGQPEMPMPADGDIGTLLGRLEGAGAAPMGG